MFGTRLKSLCILLPLVLTLATFFLFGPLASAGAASPGSPRLTTSATPDFVMTVTPLSQTRKRGTGAPYFVTITPENGFSGSVTLSLTGNIPPTATVLITQPVTGVDGSGEVDLQIEKHSILTGTFDMAIVGTSGSLVHTVDISLTIV